MCKISHRAIPLMTAASTTAMVCDFETHYDNQISRVSMRVLTAFTVLSMILMIALNGFVIVAMATHQYMSRRRVSTVLLMILVGCDLVIGIAYMPIYILNSFLLSKGITLCPLHRTPQISGHTLCMVTILTILAITTELYLAIVRPFIYQGRHNRRYYWLYLLVACIISLATILLWIYLFPKRWDNFKKVIGVTCVTIGILMICVLHAHVQAEVKTLIRKGSINNPNMATSINNHKTLRMTMFVLLAFGFCYLPFVVLSFYEIINGPSIFAKTYFLPWAEFVGISNAIWNPLIYCYRLSYIKRKALRMISCRSAPALSHIAMRKLPQN